MPIKKICFYTLCLIALCACTPDASRENFTQGMNDYLAKRGNLCLAKSNWPIDVTPAEFAAGARNAVQMPVLQKLGLVSVSEAFVETKADNATAATKVKRYQLTESGKKYYLMRDELGTLASDGSKTSHQGDFCVAKLSLDKIVAWDPPTNDNARKETVVTYTYTVKAAPWLQDPDAKRVFPMVDRVVQGARVAQLQEAFALTKDGWVAKDLLN
jgi:hypothetical protein